MNEDLISVIMPTYNYGKFLKRTINSVLGQTYRDLELIIIDNFSNDNTEEVIRSFNDQRIKYLKFANKGVIAASRNYGITNSQGVMIAFLDSDDYWFDNKLEAVHKHFKNNPGYDLICHDEYWVFEGEQDKRKHVKYGPFKKYEDLLFNGNCISTSATVVKKERLDESGLFHEALNFAGAEDYDMWLRLSKNSNIHFLHEILGEYVIHGDSFTSKIERQAEVLSNVIEKHYKDNFSDDPRYIRPYLKRKADILRQCARDLFRKNEFEKARDYLLRSLKINTVSLKAYYLLAKLIFK